MGYSDKLFTVNIRTVDGEIECVGGSFNGVPFFVEESSSNGGRNVITTALPFTNVHVNEDAGQLVRKFPIRFYLVGENVEYQREQLEEAFNTDGAFELVHPHYGKFKARCVEYSLRFSNTELEYVAGDVTFVSEQDPKKVAVVVPDVRGASTDKANKNLSRVESTFNSAFSLANKAAGVVDFVRDATVTVIDAIYEARTSMRKVSKFVNEISQIRDNIGIILMTPGDFIARLNNLITMVGETVATKGGFLDYANESLTLMDSIEVDEGTLTSEELASNVQVSAIMSSASMFVNSVVNASFSNADEVHAMQKKANEVFERAMLKFKDVEDYATLADMSATVDKYLREVVSMLAVIVEYPLRETRNVLSVCFGCYGSLDKLDEVIERNELSDPLTINRKSLKVLSK